MLKIAHLCYYYGNNTSGAPIAATRLHQALLRAGVESHYICIEQREPGENIHVLPQSWVVNRIFYVMVRLFWVLSKVFTGKMVMPNILPLMGLKKLIKTIDPDIVHVQYIGQDMMSFSQLSALRKPMVFALHDLLIANALEPHPMSDTRFEHGFVRGNSSWLERWMFNRKKALVAKANMRFVGPSAWVCEMFSRSIVGRGRKVYFVPNIIDPVYEFKPSLLRSHKKFTILFGAYKGRKSKYKGWADLDMALDFMHDDVRNNTRVCIFGESAQTEIRNGVEVVFLGEIKNPKELCRKYHEADVFALPSRHDNAPQVKFEALMTGLPVIAFQRTGCAEFIESGENGWIAPDGDLENYAAGLEYYYSLFSNGTIDAVRHKIAAKAKATFSEERIVGQMYRIYKECLDGR